MISSRQSAISPARRSGCRGESSVNVHHLELFYYVAKHGGISQAVRNMPYGIQQPAVSGQVLALEEMLNTRLFQRRPFALTPAGRRLAEFITPFFENLDEIAAELRGEAAATVSSGHCCVSPPARRHSAITCPICSNNFTAPCPWCVCRYRKRTKPTPKRYCTRRRSTSPSRNSLITPHRV